MNRPPIIDEERSQRQARDLSFPSVLQAQLPRLPRLLLRRPRLDQRLDEWAPLTVIRGLQGYGKTTLVAAWLERQPAHEVTTLFVTAHAGERIRADLLTGLDRGLDRLRLPPAGWHVHLPGSLARLRAVLAGLSPGRRLLLVVDDAQHVVDRALLDELVTLARRHRGLHLIFCGRGRHPVESLAAGRLDLCVVPAEELLCSPDEVAELAELIGVRLTEPAVERLHTAFAGWIAPTRLTLETAATSWPPVSGTDFDLAPAEAYVGDSVLSGIADRATLRRAMQLSLADQLDVAMIGELATDPQDYAGLNLMEASGLLVRHFDGERSTLRLPPVIRDVLRATYRAEDPAAEQGFHRRLAAWFDGHNHRAEDTMQAFRHAVAGRDWELAERIWRRRGSTLHMDYPQQSQDALADVPPEVMAAHPGWRVALGALAAVRGDIDSDADGRMATLLGYINSSRTVAEPLEALTLNDMLFVGTWRFIGLRATSYRESADYARSLHQLVQRRVAAGDDPGDRLPWFWFQRGLTHTVLGEETAADGYYLRAWHGRTPQTATYVCANIAANLALSFALRGERDRAQSWLKRRSEYDTTSSWGHHLVDVGARLATGLLALDRLDQATASAEIERLGHGSAPLALWPYIAYLHAQYALHYGDPEVALVQLDDAVAARDDSHTGGSENHRLLTLAQADLLAAAGHAQAAARLLRTHGVRADGEGQPEFLLALARSQLLAEDYAGTRTTLAGLGRIAGAREQLDFQLLDGAAALHLGDDETASRRITQALATYRRNGILRAFGTLTSDDQERLFQAAGRQLSEDDRRILAASRTVYPPAQPAISLTRRESTLVRALRHGRTRQQTATDLHLSVNTIKSQYADLYRKLGVNSRGAALMKLEQLGL